MRLNYIQYIYVYILILNLPRSLFYNVSATIFMKFYRYPAYIALFLYYLYLLIFIIGINYVLKKLKITIQCLGTPLRMYVYRVRTN